MSTLKLKDSTEEGGGEYIKEKKRTLGFIGMIRYRSWFFTGQPQKPKEPLKPIFSCQKVCLMFFLPNFFCEHIVPSWIWTWDCRGLIATWICTSVLDHSAIINKLKESGRVRKSPFRDALFRQVPHLPANLSPPVCDSPKAAAESPHGSCSVYRYVTVYWQVFIQQAVAKFSE